MGNDWNELIGTRFTAYDSEGKRCGYICESVDDQGLNMKNLRTQEVRSVSPRAIEKTFHILGIKFGTKLFLQGWSKLGRLPTMEDTAGFGCAVEYYERMREDVEFAGYVQNDEITERGWKFIRGEGW